MINNILNKIKYYEEMNKNEDLNSLIIFLENSNNPFSRENLLGHLTASTWIVNSENDKTLLIHHKKLNKWLQPGGHIDKNENPVDAAIRECKEELGVKNVKLLNSNIFDIDIHKIPENLKKNEPEHYHYDIRFIVNIEDEIINVDKNEVNSYKWENFNTLNKTNDQSIKRMIEKTKDLKHEH